MSPLFAATIQSRTARVKKGKKGILKSNNTDIKKIMRSTYTKLFGSVQFEVIVWLGLLVYRYPLPNTPQTHLAFSAKCQLEVSLLLILFGHCWLDQDRFTHHFGVIQCSVSCFGLLGRFKFDRTITGCKGHTDTTRL